MSFPTLALCERIEFTIASAASLATGRHINNRIPAGIFMPDTWTAASLTFQTSLDGTTWFNVIGVDGTEVTKTAIASQYIALDTQNFMGIGPYFRIRSGTSGTPVNQGAERVLTLMAGRPFSE